MRAFHVAANPSSPTIWIVSQEDHPTGGYKLASLSDEFGWLTDQSQKKGAITWELAVDKDG